MALDDLRDDSDPLYPDSEVVKEAMRTSANSGHDEQLVALFRAVDELLAAGITESARPLLREILRRVLGQPTREALPSPTKVG